MVENGPERAVVRINDKFQNSTFQHDVIVRAGVPRIEVNTACRLAREPHPVQGRFPVNAQSDKATFEIPYGTIQRPTTRNKFDRAGQFEVPALRWGDISNDSQGFSLLNASKYGYDAKDNVIRLSLLRSPNMPAPDNHVADQGVHDMTYALYAHTGDWRAGNTMRQGYELNYPLIAVKTEAHAGALPAKHAFARIEPGNVILTVMKKAEDETALIFRFYEFEGKPAQVKLELPRKSRERDRNQPHGEARAPHPARRRRPQPDARRQALRNSHGGSYLRAGEITCPSARAPNIATPPGGYREARRRRAHDGLAGDQPIGLCQRQTSREGAARHRQTRVPPQRAGTGLKSQRSHVIGILAPDIQNPFSAELAGSIQDVMLERGYTAFLSTTEQSSKRELAALAAFFDHRVAGIVVATMETEAGNEALERFTRRGLPIVLVGRSSRTGQHCTRHRRPLEGRIRRSGAPDFAGTHADRVHRRIAANRRPPAPLSWILEAMRAHGWTSTKS